MGIPLGIWSYCEICAEPLGDMEGSEVHRYTEVFFCVEVEKLRLKSAAIKEFIIILVNY